MTMKSNLLRLRLLGHVCASCSAHYLRQMCYGQTWTWGPPPGADSGATLCMSRLDVALHYAQGPMRQDFVDMVNAASGRPDAHPFPKIPEVAELRRAHDWSFGAGTDSR